MSQTDSAGLSPTERARRYRSLAEMADAEAARSSGLIRQSHQRLAEQWRTLAEYAERMDSRKGADGPERQSLPPNYSQGPE